MARRRKPPTRWTSAQHQHDDQQQHTGDTDDGAPSWAVVPLVSIAVRKPHDDPPRSGWCRHGGSTDTMRAGERLKS